MPNDVITLHCLCKELNDSLCGGRIEKIYQPEKDELTLTIKKGGAQTLLISANAGLPRLHLTAQKKENPLTASAFCMLMRKSIGGGKIESISLLNWDRIIKIDISARNEMGDIAQYFLLAELMGRYSNIILTDDKFSVVDAIKRINLDTNATRPILPNIGYIPPPHSRIHLGDKDALSALFAQKIPYGDSFLLEHISGISKDTAKEIIVRDADAPYSVIESLLEIYNSKDFSPCLRFDKNNIAADYYITPYKSRAGEYTFFAALNEALDNFYYQRDAELRKKAHTKQLTMLLNRLQNKTKRRIEEHTHKLEECKQADNLRIYGELILSNIYVIKKGDSALLCQNFYDGNAAVSIPLDKLLSAAENAQAYFKRYTKLKRAKDISLQQLEKLHIRQQYLGTLAAAIMSSDTRQEYQEIFEELQAVEGKNDGNQKKQKKPKPSPPLHIVFEGADIYIGKNNTQNNAVTFELASPNDIWLHTKDYHGAHAVIKGGAADSVLKRAAELCAYFSAAKDSPKAAVDYTLRKYVKRHKSGAPGLVTYTNYKTIIVQPKL